MFLNPDFPFRRMFQFPDRRDLFQFINGPPAGCERVGAVLRPGDDEHDILPDRDLSLSMDNQQLENVEFFEGSLTNLSQLLLCHAFIVFKRNAVYITTS